MKTVPHKLDQTDYQHWISREDSQRMLALQASWLQNQISQLQGHHLMYHGLGLDQDCIASSPIRHKFRMGLPWQKGVIEADAWMSSHRWPFSQQSIDVVVLQHSLDFTRRPHQMIREASRVLTDDGHLVIVGFNPWSWWGGLRAIMPFATRMPWVANMIGTKRLADWLALLGYTIRDTASLGHVWPLTFLPEKLCLRADSVLAGGTLMMGSFYMLTAQKTTLRTNYQRPRNWEAIESPIGWATMSANKSNGIEQQID